MKILLSVVFFLALLASSNVLAGSVNDCQDARAAYQKRGLNVNEVPRQPRQGKKILRYWSYDLIFIKVPLW